METIRVKIKSTQEEGELFENIERFGYASVFIDGERTARYFYIDDLDELSVTPF
jgi:hypothetical protein